MPSQKKAIDGVLLLDKPLGLSSNAALQRVKYLFGARKAGHSGSLDPLATGMLPICFGKSTKLAGALLDARKCYRFTVHLGTRTSTGDKEGQVIEERPIPELKVADGTGEKRLLETLARFTGPQLQTPPMYSALKHQGERLYALARKGIEVERPPRPIEIYALELESWQLPEITLRTVCSKGTYVRVLAEDIAAALGSCGHVTFLRRLWAEPFSEDQMVTLETLEAAAAQDGLERWLLHPDCLPPTQTPSAAVGKITAGPSNSCGT